MFLFKMTIRSEQFVIKITSFNVLCFFALDKYYFVLWCFCASNKISWDTQKECRQSSPIHSPNRKYYSSNSSSGNMTKKNIPYHYHDLRRLETKHKNQVKVLKTTILHPSCLFSIIVHCQNVATVFIVNT